MDGVGLYGLDLSSEELFSQTNPVATDPFGKARKAWTEVSPRVAGEGVGTRFPHPWDVLMWSKDLTHRQLLTTFFPCRPET